MQKGLYKRSKILISKSRGFFSCEGDSLRQRSEPNACLSHGMQIHVTGMRSGYEKGVGAGEQGTREYPIINKGDELPDTLGRETPVRKDSRGQRD